MLIGEREQTKALLWNISHPRSLFQHLAPPHVSWNDGTDIEQEFQSVSFVTSDHQTSFIIHGVTVTAILTNKPARYNYSTERFSGRSCTNNKSHLSFPEKKRFISKHFLSLAGWLSQRELLSFRLKHKGPKWQEGRTESENKDEEGWSQNGAQRRRLKRINATSQSAGLS